jgi:hypothetical protein
VADEDTAAAVPEWQKKKLLEASQYIAENLSFAMQQYEGWQQVSEPVQQYQLMPDEKWLLLLRAVTWFELSLLLQQEMQTLGMPAATTSASAAPSTLADAQVEVAAAALPAAAKQLARQDFMALLKQQMLQLGAPACIETFSVNTDADALAVIKAAAMLVYWKVERQQNKKQQLEDDEDFELPGKKQQQRQQKKRRIVSAGNVASRSTASSSC